MDLADAWPLSALRLRYAGVELVVPDEAQLLDLARAAEHIHDGPLPFLGPWTEGTPRDRAERVLRHQWRTRAAWLPSRWRLELAVLREGEVTGVQGIGADAFAVVREVSTGSWLARRHHGRGIGTAMRSAVLGFAFEHLGAASAVSGAFLDNPSSLRVSEKLRYEPDGVHRVDRQGSVAIEQRLRLDRSRWTPLGDELEVEGLEPCLPWFGLAEPGAAGPAAVV